MSRKTSVTKQTGMVTTNANGKSQYLWRCMSENHGWGVGLTDWFNVSPVYPVLQTSAASVKLQQINRNIMIRIVTSVQGVDKQTHTHYAHFITWS